MSKKNTLEKSQTDWAKIDAMTDDEIDYSDIPPITDEMWKNGILRKGFKTIQKKSQENLSVDRDIIEFFKAHEKNYQSKINELLRAYMKAQQTK